MPKSFEGSLDENTAILENLVTKLRICGVLVTKITPHAFRSLRAMKKRKFSTVNSSEALRKMSALQIKRHTRNHLQ